MSIASDWDSKLRMTGETNLPTGIIDFLDQEVYQTQPGTIFGNLAKCPHLLGAAAAPFGDRELYVPTRVTGVSVISRSGICFP